MKFVSKMKQVEGFIFIFYNELIFTAVRNDTVCTQKVTADVETDQIRS